MSEGFSPEQEPRQLSQQEMVEGVYAELTPQMDTMRTEVGRDVWRFTRRWLDEEDPNAKQEIYDRLAQSVRAFIIRLQQFAVIGEAPKREDADYDQLLETTMRLAIALDISLDGLV